MRQGIVMILRLSLDLPEDISYVHTTRILSRALLDDVHVVSNDIDAVETIVGELASNVIRHAHSQKSHYNVVLEYYQLCVVITVVDSGPGFRIDDIPAEGSVRSDFSKGDRVGGFGMSLLRGLSDQLNFTASCPHGTTVKVVKNLRYDTEADKVYAGRLGDGKNDPGVCHEKT